MHVKFLIPTKEIPDLKASCKNLKTELISCTPIKDGLYEVELYVSTYFELLSVGKIMGIRSIYADLVIPVKEASHEIYLIYEEIKKALDVE